jgi:phosphinothricin acetyltransferase
VTITIRPATAPDCVAVAEIYKYYVDHTVITFDYDAPTAADWKIKRADLHAARLPFLVAEDENGTVVGFAYVGQYRVKRAYDWTVENTIYLSPDHTGKGYGKTLLRALLDAVAATSVRRVISVIADSAGTGSVALHAKAGFEEVGRLKRVGYKHGIWVDCILMQFDLDDSDAPPA